MKRYRRLLFGLTSLCAIAMVFVLAATGFSKRGVTKAPSNKIRVGYIGLTCEAPIFAAVEKGFFKEEGLEVELVRCQWAQYKDVLALGGFDITHHLVMYFLKPIEQGLDVKFTGGIHRGCLRVQAPVHGKINTIEDLRGKRIGVPGMGTPPFIFANRVLGAHNIDASKEIQWKVFPAGELGLAMDKGLVDAVADSEPIGSLLVADGKVKNIADQAVDAPYKDEYCCAVPNGLTPILSPLPNSRLKSDTSFPIPISTPSPFPICIICPACRARSLPSPPLRPK
jgi:NitT/TauT family transport system substrate-binding protein